MRASFSLHGVIVPLVTPFDDQNRVDHAGVRRVVDFVIEHGVHAVMVAGTTGEGMMLSPGGYPQAIARAQHLLAMGEEALRILDELA